MVQRGFSRYDMAMDWSFTVGSLTFGTLDIIVFAVAMIGAISGCIAGFARQAARIAGFLLAIPVALLFTGRLSDILSASSGMGRLPSSLIVFVGLSLVVYIVVGLFGSQLRTVLGMTPLDHILGFALGLLTSALSLSVILAILDYQPFIDFSPFFDSSLIISRMVRPLFPSLLDVVKEAVNGL